MNQSGLNLIKDFEGCKLEAYQDQRGIWTIGVGSTKDVTKGMTITEEEADQRLLDDLSETVLRVHNLVKVTLNENQQAALESLCFNIGSGNLSESTLLKCLNAGAYQNAADEFLVWDKTNGEQNEGLLRRRKAERELFLTTV